jgi:tRNA G18 (ribose-2'-O)-methylase SpoU
VRTIAVNNLEDQGLELFRDLRDRDLRGNHDAYIVESPRVVRRFFRAVATGEYALQGALLTPEYIDEMKDEIQALPDEVPIHVAPHDLMCSISGYRFHAGALAIGKRPRRDPDVASLMRRIPGSGRCTLLLAEGVSNMDNVGAIIRDAAALGADGVILGDGCSDPLLRKAIRVSMGRVFSVPWAMCGKLHRVLGELRECHNIQSVALENLPDAPSIGTIDWPQRVAIVVGNEGHGINDHTIRSCDFSARIPTPAPLPAIDRAGGSDELSLNVSVAVALSLYARNTHNTMS